MKIKKMHQMTIEWDSDCKKDKTNKLKVNPWKKKDLIIWRKQKRHDTQNCRLFTKNKSFFFFLGFPIIIEHSKKKKIR